jgi:transcriptional regulator with XRE-family HTH domain
MFEKEIVEKLKEMHDSGKSYEEIARITGVSRTAVAEILAGKRHVKNPSLSMLLKVFPHAVIYLDGIPENTHNEEQSVSINDNSGIANGIVKGNVTIQNGSSSGIPTDLRDAILSDTTMTAKDKAALLRELMK